MEKEVRILLEEPGYRKVIEHFESSLIEIQYQWNLFFDTPTLDLKKSRRILRLRSLKTVVINQTLSQLAHRQHKHHHKDGEKKKDRKEKKEKKERKEKKDKKSRKEEKSESNEVSEVSQADVTPNSEASQMQMPINLSPDQIVTIPNVKTQWFLTLKRPGVFKDGIAIRPEKETEISSELAQEFIAHPSQILDNVPKKIKKYLKDCSEWKNFEIVGDFINYRRLLAFEHIIIEADETVFPNSSTIFELEIETEDTQAAKQKIEQKMRELRVSFVNSNVVKLARLLKLNPESRCSRVFSKQ